MIDVTSVFSYTHPGKVREQNQDSLYCDSDEQFWLLADGMGGHPGGEVASQVVITNLSEVLTDTSLKDALQQSQQQIKLLQHQDSNISGMGTTLVAVLRTSRGFRLASIGDSRIYCYEERLRQLTHDHSWVQQMMNQGLITRHQARKHEKRNLITRFIGMNTDQLEIDYSNYYPYRSGTLMLCSDGVSDYVTDSQLAMIMASTIDNELRAEKLVSCLFDTPAADNVSFILVSYEVSLGLKLLNRVT